MNRPLTNQLALAALAALALAAIAAPVASAHVELVKTHPSGQAKTSLASVWMQFDDPLRSGTLKVYGPDGSKASKGSGGRDPRDVNRLRTSLKSGLKPGRYQAKGVTLSADGHRQEWSFGFTLTR
jgi:methionine-rich copper-binding protein CopC